MSNDDSYTQEEYQQFLKETGTGDILAIKDRSTFRKISTVTNFLGDVAIGGAVGGTARLTKEVTELAYDWGKEIDYGLSRAFSFLTDETKEQTQERIDSEREDMKKWRDGNLSYISALQDESSEVQQFSSDFFSSVAKYSLAWSRLPKAWGAIKKALTAGAVEGATDSPDRELLLFDDVFIGMARLFGQEDAVKDYLDVSKPRSQTQRNLHRALSSMEIAMLSAGGEAAVMKAAPALKKGAEAAKEFVGESVEKLGQKAGAMLPDKAKEKLIDGYAAVLDKHRAAKEWLAKKARGDTIDFSKHVRQAGDDGVELVEGQLRFNFDGEKVLSTPKDFDDKLALLEKKLEELAPSIDTEVVNLKNAKRVSDENALERILGDTGRGANEAFRKEGLKGVLRVVASNAILDQETVKMAAVLSARSVKKKDGTAAVTFDQVRNSIKGYLLAAEQREAILKGYGQAMRASQGTMAGTQAIYANLREQTGGLAEAMKKFGGDLDNPEFLDAMADTLENILSKNAILGKSDDEIIQALLTQVDRTIKTKGNTEDFLESMSSMYQANLLSGMATHSQNVTGSLSRHMLMAFETGAEAAWNKAIGREAGDATFREAWYQAVAPFKAAFYGTVATGRMVATLAKGDFKGARAAAMHNMRNIPEMSQGQAERMFNSGRRDLYDPTQGSDGITGMMSKGMRTVASPVLGAIGVEDVMQRSMTARGVLEGKFHTAVYVDDVLGLGDGVLTDKEARKVIDKLWKDQDYKLTEADIAELGLSKESAKEVLDRLANFRESASSAARKAADEAVFQTPMTGVMKDVQTLLQNRMYGAGRLLTPFFSTPVNIVNDALKRAPLIQMGADGALGLPIHPQFYRDFMAGGAKQKKALAKLTSGMAMTQYFMDLAEEGVIQYVPSDNVASEGLRGMLGIQPGSIVIRGESYSLAPLGPIGIMANYAAYLHHKRELIETGLTVAPEEVGDIMKDAILFNILNFMYSVKELPWAQGVDRAHRLLSTREQDDFGETAKKFFAEKAGQLVPYSSMQRNMFNNFEHYKVIAESVGDHFKNQFFPYDGVKARNAFGEYMGNNGGWFFRNSDVNDDAIAEKALRLGVEMKNLKMKQSVQGKKGEPLAQVKLSGEEYERLGNIVLDMQPRRVIGELLDSEKFRGNMRVGRAEGSRLNRTLIQSELDSIHRSALERLVQESPSVQMKVENARKKGYGLERHKVITPAGPPPTFQVEGAR
jgi:hypothetical protein